MKNKSIKKLEKYLKWTERFRSINDFDFMRPDFLYAKSAVGAIRAMIEWEGQGKDLPITTCEPQLLADYVQGKKLRDWHITQWNEGIAEGTLMVPELLGEPECETLEDIKKIITLKSRCKGFNKMLEIYHS